MSSSTLAVEAVVLLLRRVAYSRLVTASGVGKPVGERVGERVARVGDRVAFCVARICRPVGERTQG